ncbi:scarecrow-like protein 9 [Phragmites australis]|uniref:scarecrow-like protein 9 n=1 Tax=Phragmites australis TaxID=29695 RepID=UPI002D78871D|nr:scarecrow-like protein 9 [Phragmites australis]
MEEASGFLPRKNVLEEYVLVDQSSNHRRLKKRHNREGHLEEEEVGRPSKAVMMVVEPEQIGAREMFNEMTLNGLYETSIRDMEKLQITVANEAEKKRKSGSKAVRDVVDLRTMLIFCAQAVAANNHTSAREMLKQIKQHASATGDATQRLAQCFAKGLEARLAGTGSQLRQLLMAERLSVVEFLKAYKLYMAASCFDKAALIFSIMTIEQAMIGKSKVHFVDYGLNYGLHCAGLLRWLANREGGPPEVKITAVGHPQPRSCSAEPTEETGRRLSKCAHAFGVPFKFHAITAKWEAVCIDDLNTDADEVLVVNDLFNFTTLMDESIFFDNPNPRDTVLKNISKMRPDVFIQSIVNCSYGASFLTRFREALFYHTAMFDMFDATTPRESEPRLLLEQGLFGGCALNAIACEGVDLMDRPEKYRQWQVRNLRAGLRQLPLNPNIVKVVRDKVRACHHKDFLLSKEDQWLLQGWMGRILFAHSTWVAQDASSE